MSGTKRSKRWVRAAAPLLATGVLAAGFTSVASAQGSTQDPAKGKRRGGAVFASLTQEQRDCLASKGLERPDGRPSPEQREALRAAARDCGIELKRPAWAGQGKDRPGKGEDRYGKHWQQKRAA